MNHWKISKVLVVFAFSALPAAAGVLAGNCRTGDQPSATLLVPYFEVDVADPAGRTTLFSINNASTRSALARVVLWTDWGVPTLAFDVYLTGFDVQTLNLRDLLSGKLPQTGREVSNLGRFSLAPTEFPGCDAANAGGPPLSASELGLLQAAHTGRPVEATKDEPMCLGSGPFSQLATGYVTIDVVSRCSPRGVGTTDHTPVDGKYFAGHEGGVAGYANVLWGDAFQVDRQNDLLFDIPVVHIPADPDFFAPGDYTFYGRYADYAGRDERVPLSSLYYARFAVGGAQAATTDLIVWRDTRQQAPRAYPCASVPVWAPLGELQLLAFDEEENAVLLEDSSAFPLATQKVRVGDPALPTATVYGWLMLDLWHRDGTHAQGWVGTVLSTEGRSLSYPAIRADDLCNFGI